MFTKFSLDRDCFENQLHKTAIQQLRLKISHTHTQLSGGGTSAYSEISPVFIFVLLSNSGQAVVGDLENPSVIYDTVTALQVAMETNRTGM